MKWNFSTLFLSTQPLGLTESHNYLKSKVISLIKELYDFCLTCKTQPPLDQSIDKLNSYLEPETQLDCYGPKDHKTLLGPHMTKFLMKLLKMTKIWKLQFYPNT